MGGVWDQNDRMDAAQALGPGSAQQLHQDGLGLVVQGVSGEDGVGMALRDQRGENLVAKCSRGLLDRLRLASLAATGKAVGDAGKVNVQRDFEAQAERLHKGEVSVRLVAAQAVMDVHGRQPYAERVARQAVGGVEQKQQRQRIRASGDGGADAVSGANVFAVQRGHDSRHRVPSYCGIRAPDPMGQTMAQQRSPISFAIGLMDG